MINHSNGPILSPFRVSLLSIEFETKDQFRPRLPGQIQHSKFPSPKKWPQTGHGQIVKEFH